MAAETLTMSIVYQQGLAGFVLAWAWGLILIGCFWGWGYLIKKVLSPKQSSHWGEHLVLGLAIAIVLGGLANLIGIAGRLFLLGFVLIGFISGARVVWKHRELIKQAWENISGFLKNSMRQEGLVNTGWTSLGNWVGWATVVFLVFLAYSKSVYTLAFNFGDDFQAYLVIPRYLVEIGHLPDDPFNARNQVTALGGLYLLQAFVLLFFGEQNINIIDRGIGMIAMVGVTLAILQRMRIGPTEKILTLILLLTLLQSPKVNVSALILPVGMFMGLYSLMWCDETPAREPTGLVHAKGVWEALVLSATLTLKTTLFPFVAIFYTLACLSRFIIGAEGLGNTMRRCGFVAVLVAIMLTPWLISKWSWDVTVIPFTYGIGEDSVDLGFIFSEIFYNRERAYLAFILLVGAPVSYLRWKQGDPFPAALFISVLAGFLITTVATGAVSVYRYAFPSFAAAMIIFGSLASNLAR
ncbi:MAG: hypothetical protein MN733_13305, partial [Nitrososphaera sp.]|nr:hypothetical protein [Nitrososphaera sp.]